MDKPLPAVIINSSPWIALSACGQNDLLKKLYRNILMPNAVKEEILAGGKNKIGVRELQKANWLKIKDIKDPTKFSLLHELDRGEAEVIILAMEQGIGEVILDEKVARMQAQIAGLKVVGTLGLLLRLKKCRFIKEIKPSIQKILKAGIYIHENIVEGILKEADE